MFQVFGISFHLYGLCIGFGLLASLTVFEKILHNQKVQLPLQNIAWLSLVCAVVGARAYHVLTDWPIYRAASWWEVVAVWQGGMGFFGALIGGVLGVLVGLRMSGQLKHFWSVADALAISLPFGQAIGRWGNYFNQELYGLPTSLPWGIFISPEYRLPAVSESSHFHPLFLYESILNVCLFGVLFTLQRSGKLSVGSGKFFGLYLIGYGVIRFGLEFLRIETARWALPGVAWLSVAQWVSLGLCAVGLSLLQRSSIMKSDEKTHAHISE